MQENELMRVGRKYSCLNRVLGKRGQKEGYIKVQRDKEREKKKKKKRRGGGVRISGEGRTESKKRHNGNEIKTVEKRIYDKSD